MFERFTDAARTAIAAAQEEARQFSHSQVGTEHLLLALFDQAESPAGRALGESGVSLDQARRVIEEAMGVGTEVVTAHLPFTLSLKQTLEAARTIATKRREGSIDDGHLLLLGLIVTADSGVITVLDRLGVDIARLEETLNTKRPPARGPAIARAAAAAVRTGGYRATSAPRARARCPYCRAEVQGNVAAGEFTAINPQGDERAIIFAWCAACGSVLGMLPTGPTTG